MTLAFEPVGPGPALPEEVAQFDTKLARRNVVLSGITGVWQVEARDDRDFTAYRDRDLYCIDNWSLGHDLGVLFVTMPSFSAAVSAGSCAVYAVTESGCRGLIPNPSSARGARRLPRSQWFLREERTRRVGGELVTR